VISGIPTQTEPSEVPDATPPAPTVETPSLKDATAEQSAPVASRIESKTTTSATPQAAPSSSAATPAQQGITARMPALSSAAAAAAAIVFAQEALAVKEPDADDLFAPVRRIRRPRASR
jgi:hypothetical protein